MLSHFHRLRKDEEGQSLVIACVSLLVLALCVMATINLGRVIHQRIGMQNTADAAAYSAAAVEARVYNFYAFSNRTQIVHYLSCMVWQTYISMLSFVQYMMTEILAFVETLDQCKDGDWCVVALCDVLQAIPVVGEVIAAIVEAIDAAKQALKAVVTVIDQIINAVDAIIGEVAIPAMQLLNLAMFGITEVMHLAVQPQLIDGSKDVIKDNDDQVGDPGLGWAVALGALNATAFNANQSTASQTLLGGPSSVSPDDSDKARAKKAMTEMVNATRFNNMLTNRSISGVLPSQLGFLTSLIEKFVHKYGQTKLVTGMIKSTKKNPIHSDAYSKSAIAQGNTLGADDLFYLGFDIPLVPDDFGFGEKAVKSWPDPGQTPAKKRGSEEKAMKVSVWAEGSTGVHYKVAANQDGSDEDGIKYDELCLIGGFGLCACGLRIFYAYVKPDNNDKFHPWMGITSFMNFDPGTGTSNSPKGSYHQPGTLVYRTKSYDKMIHNKAGEAGDRLKATSIGKGGGIDVATPTGAVKVNTTADNISLPSFLEASSINVMSRGMAYYHRAHNWEEPPNFFNPYWRAKLDPVAHELDQIPFVSSLPLASLPLEEVVAH